MLLRCPYVMSFCCILMFGPFHFPTNFRVTDYTITLSLWMGCEWLLLTPLYPAAWACIQHVGVTGHTADSLVMYTTTLGMYTTTHCAYIHLHWACIQLYIVMTGRIKDRKTAHIFSQYKETESTH